MEYTQIEVEHDGPVTVIRFNRPEVMNCVGLTTHDELGCAAFASVTTLT